MSKNFNIEEILPQIKIGSLNKDWLEKYYASQHLTLSAGVRQLILTFIEEKKKELKEEAERTAKQTAGVKR